MSRTILVAVGLTVVACRGSSSSADAGSASARPTSARAAHTASADKPAVEIESDGHGGYHVKGASPPTGDPKTCAAFKACCNAGRSDVNLFCAMSTVDEHDCGRALKKVKQYVGESALPKPQACQ